MPSLLVGYALHSALSIKAVFKFSLGQTIFFMTALFKPHKTICIEKTTQGRLQWNLKTGKIVSTEKTNINSSTKALFRLGRVRH